MDSYFHIYPNSLLLPILFFYGALFRLSAHIGLAPAGCGYALRWLPAVASSLRPQLQLARLTDLNPGHKKRKRTAITHFTDRFVNASSLINAIPKTSDTETALNAVFEVIRNCSIPLDNPDWAGPGLFYTRWRAFADQKHLMYYFETPFSDIFWVNLKKLDFNTLTQTLKFEVSEFQHYSGDISGQFTKTKPFTFAGI